MWSKFGDFILKQLYSRVNGYILGPEKGNIT